MGVSKMRASKILEAAWTLVEEAAKSPYVSGDDGLGIVIADDLYSLMQLVASREHDDLLMKGK